MSRPTSLDTGLAAGSVLIVAAPSGAGKSTLVNHVLAQEPLVQLSISWTTRAPRPGEVHGREYHFASEAEFLAHVEAGGFLEHAHVHGHWYGTSHTWITEQLQQGRDVLLEIDWQGAQQVRARFPSAVGIFILPPSFAALEQRLRRRGQDSEETIQRRLANARGEMRHAHEFEFLLVNQDFELAAQQLRSIVQATRLRTAQQRARHTDLFAELTV